MQIRDFLRLFIEDERSIINSLNSETVTWMLKVQLLDNFGNTPLHHLAMNGNLELIKQLSGSTAKSTHHLYKHYSAHNIHGINALHLAMLSKQYKIVQYFLENDQEQMLSKPMGKFSLLDIGMLMNDPQMVSLLIKYAPPGVIDLSKPDLFHLPPLLASVLLNAYDIARILVENGANLKQTSTYDGSNIFMLSLYEEINTEWLTYLLQRGIPIYQRNKRGIAIADVYFMPYLFSAGWEVQGKTHKSIRKILQPHVNIFRIIMHYLLSKCIACHQYIKGALQEMIYDIIAALRKIFTKAKSAALAGQNVVNYFNERDALKKKFNYYLQISKSYRSSGLSLADSSNTTQGNLVYGMMTQRILESRGVAPAASNTAQQYITEEKSPAALKDDSALEANETQDGSIPQDLLPAAYKKTD